MLSYTIEGSMETALKDGSFNAEMNYNDNIKYISITEKMIK